MRMVTTRGKFSQARIAAIYWPTFSAGGINSETQYYRQTARALGDRFDVLRSSVSRKWGVTRYAEEQLVYDLNRMTRVSIDGEASHHPDHVKEAVKFINKNYDGVFMPALIPHSNKMYGTEPLFVPVFENLKLPIVASISDGHWSKYEAWGKLALPYVKHLITGCKAYALPFGDKIPITVQPRPFRPTCPELIKRPRSKTMLTIWTHQWRDIKGIQPFLKVVPEIKGRIHLYSDGIRYYQLRHDEVWKRAIGTNHKHAEFGGEGKAEYFGWKTMNEIAGAYRSAWFSVGLQGITQTSSRPRRNLFGTSHIDPDAVYAAGSYNNSETEALFYGAIPVLHDQVRQTELPLECILTVKHASELPALLNSKAIHERVHDPRREKIAREFVLGHHDPVRLYKTLKANLFSK